LVHIQAAVQARADEITAAHPEWPCRKGCDDCCRSLAAAPQVSAVEWDAIRAAIDALPGDVAEAVGDRIRARDSKVCPLLDTESRACLVYAARPIACRTYGFYAERESVLGCERIAAIASDQCDVVWGNHAALGFESLGEAAELFVWMR
jgi:uncharacterized protein